MAWATPARMLNTGAGTPALPTRDWSTVPPVWLVAGAAALLTLADALLAMASNVDSGSGALSASVAAVGPTIHLALHWGAAIVLAAAYGWRLAALTVTLALASTATLAALGAWLGAPGLLGVLGVPGPPATAGLPGAPMWGAAQGSLLATALALLSGLAASLGLAAFSARQHRRQGADHRTSEYARLLAQVYRLLADGDDAADAVRLVTATLVSGFGLPAGRVAVEITGAGGPTGDAATRRLATRLNPLESDGSSVAVLDVRITREAGTRLTVEQDAVLAEAEQAMRHALAREQRRSQLIDDEVLRRTEQWRHVLLESLAAELWGRAHLQVAISRLRLLRRRGSVPIVTLTPLETPEPPTYVAPGSNGLATPS